MIDHLQVRSQTLMVDMVPETLRASKPDQWSIFTERIGIWDKNDFVRNGFVDHINTTKDSTDYLWHTTRLVYSGLFHVRLLCMLVSWVSTKHGRSQYYLRSSIISSTPFYALPVLYLTHSFNGICSFIVDRSYTASGNHPVLNIDSKGHAVHAFLNNILIGLFFTLVYAEKPYEVISLSRLC